MNSFNTETVLDVRHWTDKLFSFTATRDAGFRFLNGQFTMVGLEVAGRPLLRAYSMASANHESRLEFFSIKVPDGPLTSRLQHLKAGDSILVGRKATGTLIQDNLLPGETLYLLATGTGLAPFASIIKDPDTYERFRHVVLVHGCRYVADLQMGDTLVQDLAQDESIGDLVRAQLLYYPTVTREPFRNTGRITGLMRSDALPHQLGLEAMNPARDRMMLCGSPAMLGEMEALLIERGFVEGNHSEAGHYVLEKAFVQR